MRRHSNSRGACRLTTLARSGRLSPPSARRPPWPSWARLPCCGPRACRHRSGPRAQPHLQADTSIGGSDAWAAGCMQNCLCTCVPDSRCGCFVCIFLCPGLGQSCSLANKKWSISTIANILYGCAAVTRTQTDLDWLMDYQGVT